MKFRNKNTGEIIEGTEQEMEEVLSELEKTGEIADWETVSETDYVDTNPSSGKTTYQERLENFAPGIERSLSEVFPNLAEQHMQGNDEYNLGTLRAGLADVFSLPGRAVSSLANAYQGNGFNLGKRSGEEDSGILQNIARDPITGATLPIGGYLGKGVQLGANAGGKVLGTVGKVLGGAGAGAVEGAVLEGASSVLNDKPLEKGNVIVGAAFGAGFEGAGQLVNALAQRFGDNLVDASIAALMKGNVNAHVTDVEKAKFLADPKNRDALMQVLEQQTSGRNALPFVGGSDRGKTLQKNVDNAFGEIEGTVKNEKPLNDGITSVELYQDKTIYKPGQRYEEDLNYPHGQTEFPEARKFRSKKGLTKDYKYQSKAEYDLERFADKYAGAWDAFERSLTNGKPMAKDERELLDFIVAEVKKDSDILAGYNPKYVLESNKFFGDRMPFGTAELSRRIDEVMKNHASGGVSQEFKDELSRITSDATDNIGQGVANMINKEFDGRWNELERAFAYADPVKSAPYNVRKGYRNALDRFADTLDKASVESSGRRRINSEGESYIVQPDKVDKYYYQYLAHVQDMLKNPTNNRHLTPENVAALYSEATLRNDDVVKDAIIQLLEDIGVSNAGVQAFKANAGNYSMLHKAREAMKKTKKDDTLKGTVLNALVPQEGFNFNNSLGYNLGYTPIGGAVATGARTVGFGAERNLDLGK